MSDFRNALTLRNLLFADATTCAAMGLLLTVGAETISPITDIPAALLSAAGWSLFPIAAFMVAVAVRPLLNMAGAWLVIIGNWGWVAGSLLLLSGLWFSPNVVGIAFISAQAFAVAVLALLEHRALYGERAVNQARRV